MTEGLDISGFDLATIVARGLLILGLLRLLGWLVDMAPMPSRRKELLQATGPVFAVAVCLTYLFVAVQEIFGGYAAAMPLLLGSVLAAFAAALWAPIRDLLAGVFIKSGRVVRVGDEVQVQDTRGRVERLLYRRMVLRTSQGEAFLPYGLVSRHAIVRASSKLGPAAHSFRIRPMRAVSQMELRERVRQSALLCHWASPARAPELLNLEQGGLEVTVFCVDAEHAPEVESAVRRSLATLDEQGDDGEHSRTLPAEVARISRPPAATEPTG
ncbi:MAG: mechanosensitive ion channel [Myxococcales bacterium]|nr:mechanosensitive ion channel [Myxococcales bacterium]